MNRRGLVVTESPVILDLCGRRGNRGDGGIFPLRAAPLLYHHLLSQQRCTNDHHRHTVTPTSRGGGEE